MSLAGVLLVAILLGVSGLNAVSSGAVTLPSVTAPSVPAPSVNVPSVPTPVGHTPSVSTSTLSPTPPSVQTPAVSSPSAPSASPPRLPGTASLPATPGAPLAATRGVTGTSQTTVGDSPPAGSAGHSRSAASPPGAGARGSTPVAVRRRAARQQRRLQALVRQFAGCLSQLPPQAAHLLLLRAGVGLPHPYSRSDAARLLGLTERGEARAESVAVRELQGTARSSGCAASDFIFTGLPAPDHVVSWNPAVSTTTPFPATGTSTGAAHGASATGTGRRAVSAADAVRRPPHRSVLQSAVRLSTSSPGMWFVLAGFALLGSLAVLSAVGRNVATRPSPVIAAAPVPPAAAPNASVREAQAPAIAAPRAAGAATPAPVATRAPVPASPPAASAVPLSGSAPPNQTWLRGHRSHVALGLTALAGGAVRLLARRRR
jgi:hypothetical protein